MNKYLVMAVVVGCMFWSDSGVMAAEQKLDAKDITPQQELAQAQLVELVANDRVAYLQGLLAQAQEIAVRAKIQREEAAKKVEEAAKKSAPKPGTTAPKKGAE